MASEDRDIIDIQQLIAEAICARHEAVKKCVGNPYHMTVLIEHRRVEAVVQRWREKHDFTDED